MSKLRKKYVVNGLDEKVYLLSDKQLCERIISDSKSNYNWIAPARELVRVCEKKSFSKEYAITIKAAILNCFANIEHVGRINHGDKYLNDSRDDKAIEKCYNSLYGVDDEKAVSARKYFLTEFIESSSQFPVLSTHYHIGDTYNNIRNDWVKKNVEKYITQEKINFSKFSTVLYDDFLETITTAEEQGMFIKDDEKEKKEWKSFCKKMRSTNI